MGQNGDEPTVGQLVANASKDLSNLVRSELELAKTELKKTAVAAGTGAGMFARRPPSWPCWRSSCCPSPRRTGSPRSGCTRRWPS